MTLHDELTQPGRGACRICVFLSTLPAVVAMEWGAELSLPVTEVGNSAVVAALFRRGVVIDETSVRRHRRNHAT
jgi:hypothetical protein